MVKNVEAAIVEERMRQGVPVINVLAPSTFAQKHIPGSYNAPVEGPGFEEAVQRFAPDKRKPVIVHCSGSTCQASAKAARRMEAMGYADVAHYPGGMQDWEESGRPVRGEQDAKGGESRGASSGASSGEERGTGHTQEATQPGDDTAIPATAAGAVEGSARMDAGSGRPSRRGPREGRHGVKTETGVGRHG